MQACTFMFPEIQSFQRWLRRKAPHASTSIHYGVSISADGRFVAFSSLADNLVKPDKNGKADIFVRDWGMTLLTYIPLVGK